MNKLVVFKEYVRGEEGQSGYHETSSSSSIGKNSDLSEKPGGEDEDQVQSKYKGPLDAIDDLEQVLPIRKGISRFYNGKSKSFTSLAEASSTKEIAKPDNAYMRKRRNLLACNLTGGGISKRVTSSSGRSSLALAVAMSSSYESDKQKREMCNSNRSGSLSVLSSSSSMKDFSSLRSFSLADLQQHCVSVGVSCSNLHVLGAKPS